MADHANTHDGHAASTIEGYVKGFALSVVLTVIPFWLVMSGALGSPLWTGVAVMGIGAVQIVVHMVYFLHMNTKSESGWAMLALLFTIIIIAIALVGSLWVMHHLNTNMMPMSVEEMRNMP